MIARCFVLVRERFNELGLVRSSAIVLVGTGAARLFGFLFYIAAARLLQPADYGTLAYALAIVETASLVLSNAPGGLARFLARSMEDRPRQEHYYNNWLAVTALLLLSSILILLPLIPVTGLSVWLVPGLVVNLVNIAIFENYVQTQRGLGRFAVMGIYYTLANLLQLVAILIAGALGWRSAPFFLALYGFSAIAAVGLMRVAAPTPLSVRLGTVRWRQMFRIARYISPLIVQGLFYTSWWGADLILIDRLLSPTAAGNYSAAKTAIQVLTLAPTAVVVAAGPSLSRLTESALRGKVGHLLGIGALAIIPPAAVLTLIQQPLLHVFFGSRYPHAADAFNALVVGVALYGFCLILGSIWGALGRPLVGAVATGCGTVTTVAAALILIPSLGLLGGGVAFAAGAGAQLLFFAGFTVWGLFSGGPRARVGHISDEAFLA